MASIAPPTRLPPGPQTPTSGSSAHIGPLNFLFAGNFTIAWLQDTNPHDSGQTAGGPRNPTLYASRYTGGAWSVITPIWLRDGTELEFGMSSTGRAALISNPMDMSGVPWLREIRANVFNPWHPARHNLRRLIHEPAMAGR